MLDDMLFLSLLPASGSFGTPIFWLWGVVLLCFALDHDWWPSVASRLSCSSQLHVPVTRFKVLLLDEILNLLEVFGS